MTISVVSIVIPILMHIQIDTMGFAVTKTLYVGLE
jgi:hypothetical protein